MVREGPCKAVPFDNDLNEERKNIWGKNVPGIGNSTCEGLKGDTLGGVWEQLGSQSGWSTGSGERRMLEDLGVGAPQELGARGSVV